MNSLLRGAGLALALLLFGSTAAQADSILYVDVSGGAVPDIVVADDTAVGVLLSNGWTTTDADNWVGAGVVQWQGTVGAFTISSSIGTSKPVLGPEPKIDLFSLQVSGGAGSIDVGFSDVGFSWPWNPLTANVAVGGTATGNEVSYTGSIDNANAFFGASDSVSGGPFTGAFSDLQKLNTPNNGDFSMSAELTFQHFGPGSVSSVDIEVRATPEPGSIALCGLAVLGFAVYRRRRKS